MKKNYLLVLSVLFFIFFMNTAYANILYVGGNDTGYNFIKNEGYDINLADNVDGNVSNYSLVMVISYNAIDHPEWKTYLKDYIDAGGVVWTTGAVPPRLCGSHTDSSCIKDWFGASGYSGYTEDYVLVSNNSFLPNVNVGDVYGREDDTPCHCGAAYYLNSQNNGVVNFLMTSTSSSLDDVVKSRGFLYHYNDGLSIWTTGLAVGPHIYFTDTETEVSKNVIRDLLAYAGEAPNHCNNGIQDGDETGVDCGGSCEPCAMWQYRTPIYIYERSGEDLTDYQVELSQDTAILISLGRMNPDCSDIRFRDMNGNDLSYWLESGCDSYETIIHVKVPLIPAFNNAEIRMYYGNPIASSTSNGYDTFIFFDDFEDGILDNWTVGNYSFVDPVETDGDLKIAGIGRVGGWWSPSYAYTDTVITTEDSFKLTSVAQAISGYWSEYFTGIRVANDKAFVIGTHVDPRPNVEIFESFNLNRGRDAVKDGVMDRIALDSPYEEHRYEIAYDSNNREVKALFDGATYGERNLDWINENLTIYHGANIWHSGYNIDTRFRYTFLSKYVSNVPQIEVSNRQYICDEEKVCLFESESCFIPLDFNTQEKVILHKNIPYEIYMELDEKQNLKQSLLELAPEQLNYIEKMNSVWGQYGSGITVHPSGNFIFRHIWGHTIAYDISDIDNIYSCGSTYGYWNRGGYSSEHYVVSGEQGYGVYLNRFNSSNCELQHIASLPGYTVIALAVTEQPYGNFVFYADWRGTTTNLNIVNITDENNVELIASLPASLNMETKMHVSNDGNYVLAGNTLINVTDKRKPSVIGPSPCTLGTKYTERKGDLIYGSKGICDHSDFINPVKVANYSLGDSAYMVLAITDDGYLYYYHLGYLGDKGVLDIRDFNSPKISDAPGLHCEGDYDCMIGVGTVIYSQMGWTSSGLRGIQVSDGYGELLLGYPNNISVNVGEVNIFQGNGELTSTLTLDLTSEANNYIAQCTEDSEEYCTVPISIKSSTVGMVDLDIPVIHLHCNYDLDGDGYTAEFDNDCNDLDASIHPRAIEICNNVDDNCDGSIDDNLEETCGLGQPCKGQRFCNLGVWSSCSTDGNSCGELDCDILDTSCRDYADVTHTCNSGICEEATCECYNDFSPETSCNDDFNVCTIDYCDGYGSCAFSQDLDCNDNIGCTDDSCDKITGCANTPNDNNCDSDDWYNIGEPYWVNIDPCDKEQRQDQEYRDNYCSPIEDCLYEIKDNRYIVLYYEDNDEDDDGICNAVDKCPNTIIPESVPTNRLNPNSYAVLGTSVHGGSNVWKTNTGSASSPIITDSEYTLADTFGCSCEQILYCKPGANNGEYKLGCSAGTMNVWTNQKDWATYCQIDGKVVLEGESKSLLENTDNDILVDIIDSDNDNDGINDNDDQLINDADNVGSSGHGTPDWWEKKHLAN